jgi:hypothetical protein
MGWLKILGLAGLAGVAATGAVIARSERARRAYTPDEVVAMAREAGLRLVANYRALPGYRYALVFVPDGTHD